MKKFIALLICALLVMCMAPATVFAADVFDVDDVDNYATFIDSFYWNGVRLNNGDVARYTIDEYMENSSYYETRDTCGFLGWVCFYEPVKVFGYMINGELVTDESFAWQDNTALASVVEKWWPGSGELVCEYEITVPIKDLYGTNEIVAVAVLESGDIVKLNSELEPTRDTTTVFEFEPDPNATATPEPTEAPTEEPTAEPETPTEEPADEPTEEPAGDATAEPADDATDAPADEATKAPETKKEGCGSFVSGSAVIMIAAAAAGLVMKKKKH